MIFSAYFRNPEADDDDAYWIHHQAQNRHQQASLYPHNTYHGATHVHHRTPLSQADFKPIRFTDLPEAGPGYVQMTGKSVSNKTVENQNATTIQTEDFSSGTRRASNESNSEEEVRIQTFSNNLRRLIVLHLYICQFDVTIRTHCRL